MSIRKSAIILVICSAVLLGLFAIFFQFATSTFKTFNLVTESVHHWSQVQEEATYHLVQYSLSEKEVHYQNFLKDLKKSNVLKSARASGLKENFNLNMDGKLMFGERLNVVGLREVANFLLEQGQQGPLKKVNDKWLEGDNKLALLGDIASEIHDDILNHQLVAEKREYYLIRIDRLKKELKSIEAEAFNSLGETQSALQAYYQWMSLVILSLFTVLLAGISFYLVRPVLKEITSLREGLAEAAMGENPTPITILSKDFQFLYDSFNKIVHRLQSEAKDRERAQNMAGLGSWKWEAHLRKMTWSKKVFDILNLPVGMGASYEAFRDRVHLEDRAFFDNLLRPESYSEVKELPVQIRIVCNVGGRWQLRSCFILVEAQQHGDMVVISGTIQDVTSQNLQKVS